MIGRPMCPRGMWVFCEKAEGTALSEGWEVWAMRGTAYGVGVGPGDPELMTLKAIRRIRESDVIALPGGDPAQTVAYRIAVAAVPELAEKTLISLDAPMVRDRERLAEAHQRSARRIEEWLDRGKDVVCLTLGDPSIYCTFSAVQRCLEADGYETALVPGVPSFCAAAARLNVPLVEGDEPLRVVPAGHHPREALDGPGTVVLMKAGRRMAAVKDALRRSGRRVGMVENCAMEGERVCRGVEAIPDDAGYFSLIIAKEART